MPKQNLGHEVKLSTIPNFTIWESCKTVTEPWLAKTQFPVYRISYFLTITQVGNSF